MPPQRTQQRAPSPRHWMISAAILFICSQAEVAHAQPTPAPQTEAATASIPQPKIFPPKVLASAEAVYPPDAFAAGQEGRVELLVTVMADGTVGPVSLASSAGKAFDDAAIAAVRQWRFEPARRGETPVDARIRIPFQFSMPEIELPPDSDGDGDSDGEPEDPDAPIDVTVRGAREPRAKDRSASDFRIERDVLAAAPLQEGAEVLKAAPGLYIGRGEGPAVAHNYMLRGFDADHGQDIEFRVGGLPINMPSHIHGQGYSDLGFLIGDTVGELRVIEGVYDPRQGDFAVAGSIDVGLSVGQGNRGVILRSSYGSFNTFRQLAMWAPEQSEDETFGAVQFMSTDGFGDNRASQAGTGILQHRFGSGDLTFRTIGLLHAARSDIAGVVRKDDVDSERVCFYCVYPYPTAQGQNALANRFMAGFFADYASADGANGQMGFWLGYDNFRALGNFTGFIETSRVLESVSGRGDLIEQQNSTFSLGLTGRYRTAPYRPASWAHGTIELGVDARLDVIDQTQNLIDATVRNQTWDQRVDASIRNVDLGLWGDLDWAFTEYVRVRFGLRADVLSYDVEDRLGNFAPTSRPQDTYIQGFRRSALGVAWGPRTSVAVKPNNWMSVLAAYGEGYRSPQARQLEDGEDAPFSKVRSADVGLRFDWGKPLQLSLSGFYTHLSDDVAFSARDGRLERIGATQRFGAVLHAVTRPAPWLVGSLSMTLVEATLLEPPPATADEPEPPFTEGQSLPFVPPVVIRANLGAVHTFTPDLGGRVFAGRAGLGFSFLSSRPLPYGDFADPVSLLDASAGLTWGVLELTFEVFNILDAEYAAVEYSHASDWNPDDGVRSRTPARHTAAGSPRAWMLSLGVTL